MGFLKPVLAMALSQRISKPKTPDIATKIGHTLPYKPAEAPFSKGTDQIISGSSFLAHTPADAF